MIGRSVGRGVGRGVGRSAVFVAWAALGGCSGPDPASSTPTEPGRPPEPFEAAYGGCTATGAATQANLPYSDVTLNYDEHGDPTDSDNLYANGGGVWYYNYVYGEPHQRTSERVDTDAGDGSEYDHLYTYAWKDGVIVAVERDYGDDGTVDATEDRTYDDDGLMTWQAWDSDGDGENEDEVDYTWSADGDGWYATGAGADASGTYDVEMWADATGWIYAYSYENAAYGYGWELSPRNDVGNSDTMTEWHTSYGQDVETWTTANALDGLGRITAALYVHDVVGLGSTAINTAWAYDCP